MHPQHLFSSCSFFLLLVLVGTERPFICLQGNFYFFPFLSCRLKAVLTKKVQHNHGSSPQESAASAEVTPHLTTPHPFFPATQKGSACTASIDARVQKKKRLLNVTSSPRVYLPHRSMFAEKEGDEVELHVLHPHRVCVLYSIMLYSVTCATITLQ